MHVPQCKQDNTLTYYHFYRKHNNTMPRWSREERRRRNRNDMVWTSKIHIARILCCSRQSISKLFQRYHQLCSTNDRSRSGGPLFTTPIENRFLQTLHLRKRFLKISNRIGGNRIWSSCEHDCVMHVSVRPYRPLRGGEWSMNIVVLGVSEPRVYGVCNDESSNASSSEIRAFFPVLSR